MKNLDIEFAIDKKGSLYFASKKSYYSKEKNKQL